MSQNGYPICLTCNLFYKPFKVGEEYVEGKPVSCQGGEILWRPYKIWRTDIYQCKGCGHKILHGFGKQPMAVDYEPDFKELLEKTSPVAIVNDC